MSEKKTSIGCLFWIILILLVLIIILINLKPAMEVVEKTGFFKAIDDLLSNNRTSETVENEDKLPLKSEEPSETTQIPSMTSASQSPTPTPKPTVSPSLIPTPSPSPQSTQKISKKNLRRARLYYVQVTGEGLLELSSTVRSVYYDNSPLKETLLELLKGPEPAEINQGIISQIPRNTRLLNIYIKNRIAYIDLNEDFRINSLERKGHIAQLQQIIYTATEYSTVDWVQFLIQGQRVEFLGAEGVYIAEPLGRTSKIQ